MRRSKIDAILELIDGALAGSTYDPARPAPAAISPPRRRDLRPAVGTDPR